MPTYSFPIGIILAVVFGATAIVTLGKPRYGVDIKGGTILVYELDRSVQGTKEDGSVRRKPCQGECLGRCIDAADQPNR